MSDNTPRHACKACEEFARKYQFRHITSSLRYPQSNGEAVTAVKTVKGLFKKETDPYLAMLSYRATPLQTGYSLSELLMGRKLKITVPITQKQLVPHIPDPTLVRQRDEQEKQRQDKSFESESCRN